MMNEPQPLNVRLRRLIDDSYRIVFVRNFSEIGSDIRKLLNGSKLFIITDTHVGRLYGTHIAGRLKRAGCSCRLLNIPSGERSKSRMMKSRLEDELLSLNAERSSAIVALGGGVVGDIAGFVAATLNRGIPYVQIPTTLLSQVDSSIGGKVAVDHPLGKNLIGAFYQPKRVYIALSTLETLPEREFLNGMAEVIKYACILDSKLFDKLERDYSRIVKRKRRILGQIVRRCCELKRDIVQRDERESGLRRILNFGHTIGHALEHVSQYRLSHGQAVSIGMVAEAKIAVGLGMLRESECNRIRDLLELYRLPTEIPSYTTAARLCALTITDKKTRDGIVQYTLLRRIGKGIPGIGISPTEAARLLA